ncbi:MAG: DUF2975 domain-containing protein [Deltaproteobacteria bacterium]|nr:DUF2975 domain-containing protein [Deltaproteobacteria bacterium]
MDNLSKIKKFSKQFYLLLSILLVAIPLLDIGFWSLINYLPETLINVNTSGSPIVPNKLSVQLQVIGFIVSLLPLSALLYCIMNIRKLFSFYREGVIFSFEHVNLFKKTATALLLWVVLKIIYDSAVSVIFTFGNPPGQRLLRVGLGSGEITALFVGGIIFIIAWVMDEGRILNEEKELTI